MRVVHVSSFPVSRKSQNIHAVSIKISNGFIRNGHDVLNVSDRDLARARGFGHHRWGRDFANKTLIDICKIHDPDLLLLGHADTIDPGTLDFIRNAHSRMRTIQWNVDPLFDSGNIERINSKIYSTDATLVSTAGDILSQFQTKRNIVGFLPNPVDISIECGENYSTDNLPYDVFYPCGNPNRPSRLVANNFWDMNEFFCELKSMCPTVRMHLPGVFSTPKLAGSAYQTALERAAIGLNISRRPDYFLYSSDRIAHLAGNGLAVCMERGSGYEDIFSDQQFLFFSSMRELADHIKTLVNFPKTRRTIAASGRSRYISLFNERRIARYIEQIAFDRVPDGVYEWPTVHQCKFTLENA